MYIFLISFSSQICGHKFVIFGIIIIWFFIYICIYMCIYLCFSLLAMLVMFVWLRFVIVENCFICNLQVL